MIVVVDHACHRLAELAGVRDTLSDNQDGQTPVHLDLWVLDPSLTHEFVG